VGSNPARAFEKSKVLNADYVCRLISNELSDDNLLLYICMRLEPTEQHFIESKLFCISMGQALFRAHGNTGNQNASLLLLQILGLQRWCAIYVCMYVCSDQFIAKALL
jgi:hypothetical protein